MQFSQALLAALSVSASVSTIQAAPTRHGHGHSNAMRQLMIRSNPDEMVVRRSIPGPDHSILERGEFQEHKEVLKRWEHVKDPKERRELVIRDLERRGIREYSALFTVGSRSLVSLSS